VLVTAGKIKLEAVLVELDKINSVMHPQEWKKLFFPFTSDPGRKRLKRLTAGSQ
jgi:hypothetical protein